MVARAAWDVEWHFVDHSRLGYKSQLSAQSFARALVRIHEAYPSFKAFLRKMELRDSEDKINKSSTAIIHAKTGTLNFVSYLVGYAPEKVETPYAFVILSKDLSRRNKLAELKPQDVPKGEKA